MRLRLSYASTTATFHSAQEFPCRFAFGPAFVQGMRRPANATKVRQLNPAVFLPRLAGIPRVGSASGIASIVCRNASARACFDSGTATGVTSVHALIFPLAWAVHVSHFVTAVLPTSGTLALRPIIGCCACSLARPNQGDVVVIASIKTVGFDILVTIVDQFLATIDLVCFAYGCLRNCIWVFCRCLVICDFISHLWSCRLIRCCFVCYRLWIR